MWGAVASPTWLLFVVLLNSVIHTLIVYLSSHDDQSNDGNQVGLATWTKATGQFLNGIAQRRGDLFLGESCDTESSRFMLACLHTYVIWIDCLSLLPLLIGNTKELRATGNGLEHYLNMLIFKFLSV
jgi:hypothetical protein